MRSHRCATVAVIAFVLFGLTLASASITGSISGVVTDKSGAVISGASVVATDTLTGIKTTVKTDTKGFYNLPALAVGTYDLEISQAGFRTYRQTGLVIDTNSALRVDASLSVGTINENVEVSTAAALVETQNTQMGEVIEGSKMTSVPLNGRNFIDLLALQPGVSPYQCASPSQCNDTTDGVGADESSVSGDQTNGTQSVNGGRLGSNGFMVNGADAQEGVHNGAAILPNLDSISEFRIITNNFNAEYGNFSGGQVNVVTKSGTNQFHGDLFEFLRNTDFDASQYYVGRGDFIQNQFGGIFGGPIKKDRMFFFVDYQGNRQILGQAQSFPVPSLADRGGNLNDLFSQAAAAAGAPGPPVPVGSVIGPFWAATLNSELGLPAGTITTGEPYYAPPIPGPPGAQPIPCSPTNAADLCVFSNGVIPMSAWSPVAQNTLQYIPQPVPGFLLGGGPAFETSAYNQHLRDDKFGMRLDTNTHYGTLFGYYFFDQFSVTTPYAQGITVPGFDSSVLGRAEMINLGLTTTINTSTVNDVRLVYLRDRYFGGVPIGGTGVPLTSLGFPAPAGTGAGFNGGIAPITPSLEGVPSFMFNNYEFGLPQDALKQYNNTYQIIDNFTKVVGTHTLQFGVDFHYDQINERNYDDANGAYVFNGEETGVDFADYLIGAPQSFTQASQQLLDSRDKYLGVYAQDSWRARPTLTINYGLRYEIMTPWYDTQNKLETVIPGEQSQVFPGAPQGLVVPLDPGVPRTLAPIQYHNFAPRVGFAYSPDNTEGLLGKIFGGPGKSSVRVGYGIFYSAIEDATGFVEVGDAPYGLYYSAESTLLSTPFIARGNGAPAGQKFPFTFPPPNSSPSNPDTTFNWVQATPLSGSDYLYPHDKIPQVQQFEFSLQRQLGSSTVIGASYVGSVGRHLLTFEESNPSNQALCLFLSNPTNLAPNSPTCGPGNEDPGPGSPILLAPGVSAPGYPGVTSFATSRLLTGLSTPTSDNFISNPYMITAVSSSFNSLQVSVKHTEKYANFLVAYTYEKSIDNGSSSFDATNPLDPRQDRALSVFDVPQDLTVSYTLQMPFDKLTGGVPKRLTEGWALSGIMTLAKGEPVQLMETDDNSLSGTFNDTVDIPSYNPGNGPLFINKNPRNSAGQPYFNPNYFTFEPLGQVGNAMRRYFVGPGINNFDMALLKDTGITESVRAQFRAEAFNIFNHAQFNNPSGNVDNTGVGGFGYVTSARAARIMQLALKFLF
jgi:Carboxypeptidase regulatory-like domain